jgi:mercuric ion binding protein
MARRTNLTTVSKLRLSGICKQNFLGSFLDTLLGTTGASNMKHIRLLMSVLITPIVLLWSGFSFAAGTQYNLRVDGLACPFCAYGIEKKFIKTEGVESVDIDLQNGLVIVNTAEGKTFKEDKLKEIINDAGFTMKSMTEKDL